jgi:hypothetical protein
LPQRLHAAEQPGGPRSHEAHGVGGDGELISLVAEVLRSAEPQRDDPPRHRATGGGHGDREARGRPEQCRQCFTYARGLAASQGDDDRCRRGDRKRRAGAWNDGRRPRDDGVGGERREGCQGGSRLLRETTRGDSAREREGDGEAC